MLTRIGNCVRNSYGVNALSATNGDLDGFGRNTERDCETRFCFGRRNSSNPIACLLCCSYGVAIFDRAQLTQAHNPNVVYELGMMQLLKRPCVILKHAKLRKMPTDLLSMLYEGYSSRQEAADKLGAWWARNNA